MTAREVQGQRIQGGDHVLRDRRNAQLGQLRRVGVGRLEGFVGHEHHPGAGIAKRGHDDVRAFDEVISEIERAIQVESVAPVQRGRPGPTRYFFGQ